MPRVTLIFPPFAEHALCGPHLACPLLCSILIRQGIHATNVDLNIRVLRRVTEPDVLDFVIHSLMRSQSTETVVRSLACVRRLSECSIDEFAAIGWDALPHALRIIRSILFPVPRSLEDCLTKRPSRPEMAEQIYASLLCDFIGDPPDMIGFSVAFGEQLAETIELAYLARRILPRCRLILGGSQVNLLGETQVSALAQSRLFDRIVLGNGETTIVDAVKVDAGSFPSTSILRSLPAQSSDLVNLPSPQFQDIDLYFRPLSIPTLVTRGCYWGKCTFCDYVRLSNMGEQRYAARPVEDVLAEIREIQRAYSPDQVMLISDAVPPHWYRKLAELAIAENLELKTWSYMMHSSALDKGFFHLLSDAGVRYINFGTESTNDRILQLMNKQSNRDVIIQNIQDACSFNVGIAINVIPDFPTTTFDEALSVAKDFQSLLPYIDVLTPSMFDLTAGTPISTNPAFYHLHVKDASCIRSDHGYHSIPYVREDALSATGRAILEQIFDRLACESRIRSRLASLALQDWSSDDVLVFDGSAVIIRGQEPEVWLISLRPSWPLAPWELDILDEVFERRNRRIAVRELGLLFHGTNPEGSESDSTAWLDYLARTGMIVEVRRGASSKHLERLPPRR